MALQGCLKSNIYKLLSYICSIKVLKKTYYKSDLILKTGFTHNYLNIPDNIIDFG